MLLIIYVTPIYLGMRCRVNSDSSVLLDKGSTSPVLSTTDHDSPLLVYVSPFSDWHTLPPDENTLVNLLQIILFVSLAEIINHLLGGQIIKFIMYKTLLQLSILCPVLFLLVPFSLSMLISLVKLFIIKNLKLFPELYKILVGLTP